LDKKSRGKRGLFKNLVSGLSALTRFETRMGFVDDVNAAFTTDNTAIAMTRLQGAKRVLDFHSLSPISGANRAC